MLAISLLMAVATVADAVMGVTLVFCSVFGAKVRTICMPAFAAFTGKVMLSLGMLPSPFMETCLMWLLAAGVRATVTWVPSGTFTVWPEVTALPFQVALPLPAMVTVKPY